MKLWQCVKAVAAAVGRFWWRGMNRYTGEGLRAEIEALERYRDFSRGHYRAPRPREDRRGSFNRPPCV